MCNKQYPTATSFCIHDGSNSFTGAGRVIKQSDSLLVGTHRLKGIQSFLLIFPKLQFLSIKCLTFLCWQVIFNFLEAGIIAKENAKLVLYGFRLLLHLANGKTVDIPAEMHHAVLLQKIIAELVHRNVPRVMRYLVINFDGNARCAVFKNKIRKACVLVNVIEGILRIQISRFFCAERIGEQLDKQILCGTARCRSVFSHGITSLFKQSHMDYLLLQYEQDERLLLPGSEYVFLQFQRPSFLDDILPEVHHLPL